MKGSRLRPRAETLVIGAKARGGSGFWVSGLGLCLFFLGGFRVLGCRALGLFGFRAQGL